jgi:hypothetical protein
MTATVFDTIGHFVNSLSIVSLIFIGAIIASGLMFNTRYTGRVAELGPTILTTLGIFGTFLSVGIGLSQFDTSNLQAGVPLLLAGLKTAFWPSVFGVGAAVQLKMREFLADVKTATRRSKATPLEVLMDIREALAGYSDSSLPLQMRSLRQDINDRLIPLLAAASRKSNERLDALRVGQRDMVVRVEALETVQKEALYNLSAGAAETLVGALNKVVLSFNDKIAHQFGQNYRELGQAVTQLVTWQNEYRVTVKALTDQLAETLRLLGYAASDFRTASQGSARFAQTADRVAKMLDGIEAGEQRMIAFTQTLNKLTEDAAGRIPLIESRLLELTSQMAGAVRANQSAANEALTGSAAALQQSMAAAQEEFTVLARTSQRQLKQNQRAIAEALGDNAVAMTNALQEMQRKLLASMAAFEAQTAELIRRGESRVIELDETAAAGLTRSVGTLVGQLTAQIEAAGSFVAERTPRGRPMLQVVADAAAGEDS